MELKILSIHAIRLFEMKPVGVRFVHTFINPIWHWQQHAVPCA